MATETATLVFTDLVGSTSILASVGEERFDALRVGHFSALRRALQAHNGTEVKNLGDGLMAVFGSASDAVSASVAMQQEVELLDRQTPDANLAIRIGVAAGDVTRDEGDYFGTPVVEAARLCAKAPDGSILITELVRMLAGNRGGHAFGDVERLELKGLAEPVAACALHWLALAPADRNELSLPFPARLERRQRRGAFVGREQEMTLGIDALKHSSAGHRQVIAIRGEPGIGKTRFAIELARHAHASGAAVLFGHCAEELAVAYQPIAEALRHLVDHLPVELLAEHTQRHGDDLAVLVPSLNQRVTDLPVRSSADPETDRLRLFDATTDVLELTATRVPVVLVLDDLHWASAATVMMLRHLIEQTDDAALLIVVTYRDTDLGRDHPLSVLLADLRRVEGVHRVALGGLGDDGTVALMASLAGHDLDDDSLRLARAILDETGGSPFFIIELLRHLEESGGIQHRDGRWVIASQTLTLPESVRDVIGRRLDRLGAAKREVLAAAAVVGREFNLEVLRAVVGSDDAVYDTLEMAVAGGLVTDIDGEQFAFSNALVRSTLVEELGNLRRRRLQRNVAETLETMSSRGYRIPAAELARHWLSIVSVSDTDRAVRHAAEAGEQAIRSLAFEEAVSFFDRALEVHDEGGVRDDAIRIDLLLGSSRARRGLGEVGFRSPLGEAIALAADSGDIVRQAIATLAWARGLLWAAGTQVDEVYVARLQDALAKLGDDHPALRSRLLAQLGVELVWNPDASLRAQLTNDAVSIARQHGDRHVLLDALLARATAQNYPAGLRQRIADTDEALGLATGFANGEAEFRALYLRTMAALEDGDAEGFNGGIAKLGVLAEVQRSSQYRWLAQLSLQCGDLLRCRADEASLTECYVQGEQSGNADAFAAYSIQLWMLAIDRGGLEPLIDVVRSNIETAPDVPAWKVALLSMTLELGLLDDARDALDSLADTGHRVPLNSVWLSSTAQVGEAAVTLGNRELAAQVLADLAEFHDQVAVTANSMSFGSIRHTLGALTSALGDTKAAIEHLEAALACNERLGALSMVARSARRLADLLLDRDEPGDRQRAAGLVQQARSIVDEVPLPHEVPRVAATEARL